MTSSGGRRVGAGIVAALVAAVMAAVATSDARAAGSAYQVDTSDVSDAGSCKIESWLSWASNRDFVAATNPSCAFNFGRPVELSAQFTRTRSDGEWGTAVAPKVKMNLVPSGIGTFGFAVTATTGFDLLTGENTGIALTIPATVRLTENTRINLNAGWSWDRIADRHYFSYGVGFDWRTPDNVWTLTTELFGLVGSDDTSNVQPRFQAGLRYRPIDRFSVDLIYGRNITGENANWITVATVVRFPVEGKTDKNDK